LNKKLPVNRIYINIFSPSNPQKNSILAASAAIPQFKENENLILKNEKNDNKKYYI